MLGGFTPGNIPPPGERVLNPQPVALSVNWAQIARQQLRERFGDEFIHSKGLPEIAGSKLPIIPHRTGSAADRAPMPTSELAALARQNTQSAIAHAE
jgi:hypothetical protein